MLEGVVFDMDGVMFDTERMWDTVWVPILKGLGVRNIQWALDHLRGTSGASMDRVFEHIAPDADAPVVRELAYATMHDKVMASGAPKKPGLDELLAYLVAERLPLAVASSSELDVIESNLQNGGVRDCFGHLFSGFGMERPKPAPDIFLAAARALGTSPAHTLVIEDSLSGVRAGVAGGFITVMVPDLVAPDDFVRENAACICKDLLEVRNLLAAGRLG